MNVTPLLMRAYNLSFAAVQHLKINAAYINAIISIKKPDKQGNYRL